jgi:predicted flavoprotein YhiN
MVAACMMCARARAGKRGRSVLVLDHAAVVGEKIRISRGGRCNFTNLCSAPEKFLWQNPHFCTPRVATALVETLPHLSRKDPGQTFLRWLGEQIIDLLSAEMKQAKPVLRLATSVANVENPESSRSNAVTETRPALVPLVFDDRMLVWLKPLAGIGSRRM